MQSDRFSDMNQEAYLEMLAAGTRLIQNPEARKEMEILLAKHNRNLSTMPEQSSASSGGSSNVKKFIKSLIYSPVSKLFWMSMARTTGMGLPLDQKFTFRSSREALDCALHYPAQRVGHNHFLKDLFTDPAGVTILDNSKLQKIHEVNKLKKILN